MSEIETELNEQLDTDTKFEVHKEMKYCWCYCFVIYLIELMFSYSITINNPFVSQFLREFTFSTFIILVLLVFPVSGYLILRFTEKKKISRIKRVLIEKRLKEKKKKEKEERKYELEIALNKFLEKKKLKINQAKKEFKFLIAIKKSERILRFFKKCIIKFNLKEVISKIQKEKDICEKSLKCIEYVKGLPPTYEEIELTKISLNTNLDLNYLENLLIYLIKNNQINAKIKGTGLVFNINSPLEVSKNVSENISTPIYQPAFTPIQPYIEENTLSFYHPEKREKIELMHKTDFYTVSPKYWDSSGMKFDNDQKLFYGTIPGTNIDTVLRGTGFYVNSNQIDAPAVNIFVNTTLSKINPQYYPPDTFEYDFALSFAGEDRNIVDQIAKKLEKGVKVFYDSFYKADLLGKDLSEHFKKIYGGKTTKYVVIFISKNYAIKDWTNFEFEIAKDEAKKRKEEYILPVRLDDTIIQGVNRNIGYVNYQKEGLEGVINILLKKIGKLNIK